MGLRQVALTLADDSQEAGMSADIATTLASDGTVRTGDGDSRVSERRSLPIRESGDRVSTIARLPILLPGAENQLTL